MTAGGSCPLVFVLAALFAFAVWTAIPVKPKQSQLQAAQEHDPARLEQLRTHIEKMIGTPGAGDLSQCGLIAFGSKPCGGPRRYLVYSTVNTDGAALKSLVEEFNRLDRKINEERKLVSDCMLVAEPKVELVNGVCAAQAG